VLFPSRLNCAERFAECPARCQPQNDRCRDKQVAQTFTASYYSLRDPRQKDEWNSRSGENDAWRRSKMLPHSPRPIAPAVRESMARYQWERERAAEFHSRRLNHDKRLTFGAQSTVNLDLPETVCERRPMLVQNGPFVHRVVSRNIRNRNNILFALWQKRRVAQKVNGAVDERGVSS
jgi:hypothetical protein